MDEKQPESDPRERADQHRNEAISADEGLDAPTPADALNGGWTFATQRHYDSEEPLTLTNVIIEAIADAEGVPFVEIKEPPLYEVVDAEALEEALFNRPTASRESMGSSAEFHYNGYKVKVEADGWVTVLRQDGQSVTGGE